jgi:outer membrane protein insertion porin family
LEKSVSKSPISNYIFPFLFLILNCCFVNSSKAQISFNNGLNNIDYSNPAEYEIGGITVSGVKNFDASTIILYSGLAIGDKVTIPGDKISKAIRNLWKQKLFANVIINAAEVRGNVIFLNIELEERARLSTFGFKGVSRSNADDLRDKIQLLSGTIVNENLITNTTNIIRNHYVDKGFLYPKVNISQVEDSVLKNSVRLVINIDKGTRIKINEIKFEGISDVKTGTLKRAMKGTKEKDWYKIFSTSKFIRSTYKNDKNTVIDKLNERGYRNARILGDSVYKHTEKTLNILIKVDQGQKFYFRNIVWVGNIKYDDATLSKILGIKKGETYNKAALDERLKGSAAGNDISSLYLDDGYLSFFPNPIETAVSGDSIDLEIRIYEGKQFRVNRIRLMGNTKTNDHVVLREIRTLPGELFSRNDLIRSQRELATLGYFNPEAFGINPIQNPADGTVDIEYTVEEKPSDQIELSGGWGAGRVVGTLGVRFTNFSLRNFFNKKAWTPLPSGDGQQLSIRAQSNGLFYQAYTMSFVEPWLGGKRRNSLSFSLSHSVQTNGQPNEVNGEANPLRQSLLITGGSVGLGKQLQWPDDFFSLYQAVSFQHYNLNNFGSIFSFSDGYSNNLAYTFILSRNSINQPLYPRFGSEFKFTFKATPPFSVFDNKDYANVSDQEKFKFVEYHKWKFTTSWFTEIAKDLVINARTGFGFLGSYNDDIGPSPFERYYLGGSALSGYSLDGREIIGLRGYDDRSLSPVSGALFITKYSLELRYPLSLNPSATIYGMGFAEAGKTWSDGDSYNPFDVYKSAGVGLRIFLPMFGLMGLDYGWRFDDVSTSPNMPEGQFHFTIGMNLGEL